MVQKQLILLCLYNNTDTSWMDEVFNASKVLLSEMFDLDGSNCIPIGDLNQYHGWDYIVVPLNPEHRDMVDELLDKLAVPNEKRVYIIKGDIVTKVYDEVKEILNPGYIFQLEYKKGTRRIIKKGRDSFEYIWGFIGTNLTNMKMMYGGFGKEKGFFAYYMDPLDESPIVCLEGMITYLHKVLDNKSAIPCIIVYARILDAYPYIQQMLKAHFPSCRLFLFYGDLIEKHGNSPETAKNLGFEQVFTFDRAQAEMYGIPFLRVPFSCVEENVNTVQEVYDVVFVGECKDRLEMIFQIHEKLTKSGMRCAFYVWGVPDKDKERLNDIHCNEWLEYDEVLSLDQRSKVILEVMQGDGTAFSPTVRYAESKVFRKKLLSNCPELKKSEDKNVIYFETPGDIALDRLKEPYVDDGVDYIKMFSVEKMIETIGENID